MSEAPCPVAFLDASVLYPALLRNLLMHFAINDLFRPRWSSRVHEEWIAALLRNRPDISRRQLDRTRLLMELHIDDAQVDGYDHLIEAIALPDADDRHVVAAAIHGKAQVIVTANLRDFPAAALAPFDLVAEHPDDFLLRLLTENEALGLAAFHELCGNHRHPPQSFRDVILLMERQTLTRTAAALVGLI